MLASPLPPVGPNPPEGSIAWEGLVEEEVYVGRGVRVEEACVQPPPPNASQHGEGEPLLAKFFQGCPPGGDDS